MVSDRFQAGRLLVFRTGDGLTLYAGSKSARLLLLGGAVMNGPRHLSWNFVSSSKERIEQARADWKAGRFGTVPGDNKEFLPLREMRVKAETPSVQVPGARSPTSQSSAKTKQSPPRSRCTGFITEAYDRGLRDRDIMGHSRHHDVKTMHGYVRLARLLTDSPAGRVGL